MKKIRLVSMLLCLVMLLSFMAVPAAAAESAKPTSSKVYVNSINRSFEAYNIKDYNYFKLRDLGIVSGLAATGTNQIIKQLAKSNE